MLRERNEVRDCRVYARAASWIAGADRWIEARWRDLERQLRVEGEKPKIEREYVETTPTAPVAGNVRRTAERRGRRIFRSSYLA